MSGALISFTNGDAYQRGMGPWSQLVGNVFIDWLAPRSGMRWIDIGCGNGSFTELIARRRAPSEIQGIDPSEVQIAFARKRVPNASFQIGDAMALRFVANRFDAAMALVLFFVPDPAKGVSEMARVVSPGGAVAAYLWDNEDGRHPTAPLQEELLKFGIQPVHPVKTDISHAHALRALWTQAGLSSVETLEITVNGTFPDHETLWQSITAIPTVGPAVASMSPSDVERLKGQLQARLPANATGAITYASRAIAIKGVV